MTWFDGINDGKIETPDIKGAKVLDRKDLPSTEYVEWARGEMSATLIFKYFQLKDGRFVIRVGGNDGYQTFDNGGAYCQKT